MSRKKKYLTVLPKKEPVDAIERRFQLSEQSIIRQLEHAKREKLVSSLYSICPYSQAKLAGHRGSAWSGITWNATAQNYASYIARSLERTYEA